MALNFLIVFYTYASIFAIWKSIYTNCAYSLSINQNVRWLQIRAKQQQPKTCKWTFDIEEKTYRNHRISYGSIKIWKSWNPKTSTFIEVVWSKIFSLNFVIEMASCECSLYINRLIIFFRFHLSNWRHFLHINMPFDFANSFGNHFFVVVVVESIWDT